MISSAFYRLGKCGLEDETLLSKGLIQRGEAFRTINKLHDF
jgi:hypothetical protein